MKHIECKTAQGRNAEAEYFCRSGKDWIRVRLFGYHTAFEFCLEYTSLEDALKYLDDNIESIEKAEDGYSEERARCND